MDCFNLPIVQRSKPINILGKNCLFDPVWYRQNKWVKKKWQIKMITRSFCFFSTRIVWFLYRRLRSRTIFSGWKLLVDPIHFFFIMSGTSFYLVFLYRRTSLFLQFNFFSRSPYFGWYIFFLNDVQNIFFSVKVLICSINSFISKKNTIPMFIL